MRQVLVLVLGDRVLDLDWLVLAGDSLYQLRRLQGIHRLTRGFLIQINIPDDWQLMAEFEDNKHPILKRGPDFFFTFFERRGEGEYAWAGIRPEKVLSSSSSYCA